MTDALAGRGLDLTAGRELDALVAEYVMGAPHECRLVGAGTHASPMELDYPNAAWRVRSPSDGFWERWSPTGAERVVNDFVPCYSTDLAAAWEVVEKLGRATELRWQPGRASAQIGVYDPPGGIGQAETLAHAICLAALNAVGAQTQDPGDHP